MALQKDKTYATGVTASYHRITRMVSEVDAGRTLVEVGAYLDADAREAGRETLSRTTYDLSALDLTRPAAYERLKQHADFDGAEDI